MGKKHKHPEHENLERWLVSYADFITLLFATFVVLYALGQADLAKLKDLSQSLKQAFNPAKSIMDNPGGVMPGTPNASILKDSGNSILDKVMPKFPENAQREGSLTPVTDAVQQINEQIEKLNGQKTGTGEEITSDAKVKLQERGIVISFASSLFFEPGSAGLKPEAFSILNKLADTLKSADRVIHVEGHTDNQPIATAVYPSNWELSTARASSVVRYFISKKGFDPAKLAAVGYAHTRPIADNLKAEGRAKNRRVDIVILFTSALKEADAGAAQEGEKVVVVRSSESDGLNSLDKKQEHEAEDMTKAPDIKPKPLAHPVKPHAGHKKDSHH